MPIEVTLLRGEDPHFDRCPKCGEPFYPFLRGQVHRSKRGFWWFLTLEDRPYSALICSECKEIVGYENPYDRTWVEVNG